jgi:hypothetical protein
MDNKSEKAILRAKLERYRLLSRQFPDGMTEEYPPPLGRGRTGVAQMR